MVVRREKSMAATIISLALAVVPLSLTHNRPALRRHSVARACPLFASLIVNETSGEWVEEAVAISASGSFSEEDVFNEKEPPLTAMWMPLRETGEALRVARLRKRLRQSTQLPIFLAPVAALSWWALPVVGAPVAALEMGSTLDVTTFASLVDIVIGALGVILGILVGTVVQVLRTRLQELREELYNELAIVETCVQQHVKLFRRDKPRLRRSMLLLRAYMVEWRELLEILANYDVRFDAYDAVPWARHFDRQQRRGLEMLDVLAEMGDGALAGPRYGNALFSSLAALEAAETAVMQLNERRSARRANLESKFPPNVFIAIFGLMFSIVMCFVLRAAVVGGGAMLSEPPVRYIFSFLTISFAGILQIILDLSDPFSSILPMALRPGVVDPAIARVRYAIRLAEAADEPIDRAVEDDMAGGIRPALQGRYDSMYDSE